MKIFFLMCHRQYKKIWGGDGGEIEFNIIKYNILDASNMCSSYAHQHFQKV